MPLFGKKKKRSLLGKKKKQRSPCNNEEWSPDSDLEKVAANDPSLTTVDWCTKGIGDDEVIKLSDALCDNTHVTILWLGGNMITDAGMKALAKVLKINTKVTTLSLGDNKVTDASVKALVEVLPINDTITHLHLGGNKFTDVGKECLMKTVPYFMMSLWERKWSPRSDLEKVTANDPSLTEVNWQNKGIGDDEVIKLANALHYNTHISELVLTFNNITDIGAKVLAKILRINATVTTLNLYWNKIGDASAKDLAEMLCINASVTQLNLSLNQISDTGAKALAEMLRVNATITHLNLEYNEISNIGVKALAEMLRINVAIITLDLACYNISDDLQEEVNRLSKINKRASHPEEAFGEKVKLAVSSEHGSSEDVMSLALAGLDWFPESYHFKNLAASVDIETGKDLYRFAAKCGAAAALVHLLRAHPSLCEYRDREEEIGGLYPFMLLATMATARVGSVFEALRMKPDLVVRGIS
eukprot:CAMPEP_0197444794 /NCGR_PEP_ID=MMETSP1175-20131217/10179_1 /TAXON_ID=1003142 /ORGANISM="Triceratium dubium, Strain CCMP147" /LENGTH=472 /DNA_ID=CAMNT_0042975647 /DNA_START=836 /DNA_END=2254 /DNA_ORIENTATION=-